MSIAADERWADRRGQRRRRGRGAGRRRRQRPARPRRPRRRPRRGARGRRAHPAAGRCCARGSRCGARARTPRPTVRRVRGPMNGRPRPPSGRVNGTPPVTALGSVDELRRRFTTVRRDRGAAAMRSLPVAETPVSRHFATARRAPCPRSARASQFSANAIASIGRMGSDEAASHGGRESPMTTPRSHTAITAARLACVIVVAFALLVMPSRGCRVRTEPAPRPVEQRLVRRHRPGPTRANSSRAEAATLCLINVQRARHGERALRPNADLARSAADHSAGHGRPRTTSTTSARRARRRSQRIKASTYLPRRVGLPGRREHRARHDAAGDPGSHRRKLDEVLATIARTSSNADFRDSGIGIVAQAPSSTPSASAARPTRSSSASSPSASRARHTTSIGVPTEIRCQSRVMSALRRRMQPCDGSARG